MRRFNDQRCRHELRLRLIEKWRVGAFSEADPDGCGGILYFVKLLKLLAKIMSAAPDAGIGRGRVTARASKRVSANRVFCDFAGSAGLLHFAYVPKKFLQLIGSSKRLALEYSFQSLLLFLGTERMFGQRSHLFLPGILSPSLSSGFECGLNLVVPQIALSAEL